MESLVEVAVQLEAPLGVWNYVGTRALGIHLFPDLRRIPNPRPQHHHSECTSKFPNNLESPDSISTFPNSAMSTPLFWSTPLRYCRWASRERPALYWSVIIGLAGPVVMVVVPPVRRYFGDVDPAPVPLTYPVPTGPRKQLSGYDD
ncbi:hypothetical protein E4U35_001969 [Claviceps purpurea]|nr:hypothetical protein E4U37_008363 [Claviceps purpurea]KAG6162330.1 hypothetical protein E4U51_006472 [Claviceps purpurea]KAG6175124.1 hypothetical protein E4U27_006324 [Claviceps purpurea]KAG6185909.1 hypothetical protein E4U36_001022 [Claviceps purpurea]KAG6206150.1 hypothetical protein E4U35_001969 [Claviceps purpurea]